MAEESTSGPHSKDAAGQGDGRSNSPADEDGLAFKVRDRRHWQQSDSPEETEPAEVAPARPSIVEQYRQRTEAAEKRLLEYVEAFKQHKEEQEQVRERLARDVERRVELNFGELVNELLETVDDLDLGLSHVQGVPEAKPLAQGVAMARDRFLSILERHGITKLVPAATAFDPSEAEAVRVDAVDSPEADGVVTETLKPGYRMGDRVLRAAQVAVGRYAKK